MGERKDTDWLSGAVRSADTRAPGVCTIVVRTEDGEDHTALVAEFPDRGVARHVLPLVRRLGRGSFTALEDVLRRGALPGSVVRDLHRLLRDAEDEVASAKRNARNDLMRGRLR